MLLLQHRALGLIGFACCLASAQTFDAASVKPAILQRGPMAEPAGGPGSKDPGRIHYPAVTLQFLLLRAYDVTSFQLSGPGWLETERFDVDATMPAGTAMPQFRTMLRNLLAERFQLTAHAETKDVSGYSLVVRNRLKLKESAGPPAPPNDGAPVALQLGADNYFVPPARQGVFFQLTGMKSARSTFRQVTMPELAATLQDQLKRPVTDDTGLTAKYDFVLSYATEGLYLGSGRIPVGPGGEDAHPDISSALSEQLGLKLEAKKVTTQAIVIDHIEKTPTGN
ncbi:MAG: TIGR03435 family protein [Candidatus Sulfopaludibacter sp.]|nr:TIGR03435 family protein [Candidatus Sulfopaludibacter sp.]